MPLKIRHFLSVILFGFLSVTVFAQDDLDDVILQLKWKHQFQFAGYYAAEKMGYYRDAGLNVTILEAEPGHDPAEAVLSGKADFGVGTTDILLLKERGEDVVLLASIFQHSPAAFLSIQSSDIENIHNLADHPIMIEELSTELLAYLHTEGVDINRLNRVEHDFTEDKILAGDIGSMSIYTTDEVFLFEQKNIEYRLFRPLSGGLDFYGDNLFTVQNQIDKTPERVEKFLKASLAGWQYAMTHKQELVDHIIKTYGNRKSREHLLFEAHEMEKLLMPEVVPIGFSSADRWVKIEDYYANLGFLSRERDMSNFIYDANPISRQLGALQKQTQYLLWGILAACLIAGLFVVFTLRLRAEVEGRKSAELEMKKARDAAEIANQAKTVFLATIGHEIRTPLTGLLGTSHLLNETKTSKEQQQLIERIDRSGHNLLQLLNDVLDFSKNESEQLQLDLVTFSIVDLLDDICDLIEDKANEKNLDLKRCFKDVSGEFVGDPLRLRQIVTNLIDNAIKFTDKGSVTIEAYYLERDGQNDIAPLCFSVSDTGIGIKPEKINSIFDAFTQEDSGTTRHYGGSGLGLSICKQLVEKMHGEMLVESIKGEGSIFSFVVTLPPAAQAQTLNDSADKHKAKPLKILLVDDAEDNRLVLSLLLRSAGHDVSTVSTGEGAIASIQAEVYDLVLMDIRMPGMDGIEATKHIRHLPPSKGGNVIIFALTADVATNDTRKHASAGMAETLSKPFQLGAFNHLAVKYFGGQSIEGKATKRRDGHGVDKLIDRHVLVEYASLVGRESINEILITYEKSYHETFKEMSQALKDEDMIGFDHCLHKLLGSAGVLGFSALNNVFCDIRNARKADNIKGLEKTMLEVEVLLMRTVSKAREIVEEMT